MADNGADALRAWREADHEEGVMNETNLDRIASIERAEALLSGIPRVDARIFEEAFNVARGAIADVERLLNERDNLLGLQPGEQICGAKSGGLNLMTRLLPARHVDEVGNGWHRGLGGTWSA
jgi:hypothetical protein